MSRSASEFRRTRVVELCRVVGVSVLLLGTAALVKTTGQQQVTRTVSVDCSSGESIMQALEGRSGKTKKRKSQRDADALLIIEVSGVCQENVVVTRDKVTFIGVTPGAGVSVLSGHGFNLSQVDEIVIEDLTMTGAGEPNSVGINASQGTTVNLYDVLVSGFDFGLNTSGRSGSATYESVFEYNGTGILVYFNASLYLQDSDVRNNTGSGIQTFNGGNVQVAAASVVEWNGSLGLYVGRGSSADLGNGVVVSNNNIGVLVRQGDFRLWTGSVVRSNNHGVLADTGASVNVGGTQIRDNVFRGLWLRDTAAAAFQGGTPACIQGNDVGVVLEQAAVATFRGGPHLVEDILVNDDAKVSPSPPTGALTLGSAVCP